MQLVRLVQDRLNWTLVVDLFYKGPLPLLLYHLRSGSFGDYIGGPLLTNVYRPYIGGPLLTKVYGPFTYVATRGTS